MASAARFGPQSSPVIDLTVADDLPINPVRTISRIRATIDLTNTDDDDDDSPAGSPRLLKPASEPPRKRQRIAEDGAFQTSSRALPACLKAQVKPYIDAYLAEIPSGTVNAVELGRKVLLKIASTTEFDLGFKKRKGFLTLPLEKHLAGLARRLIFKFASEPEFQLDSAPTSTISPAARPTSFNPSRNTPSPAPAFTPPRARPFAAEATVTAAGPAFTPVSSSENHPATRGSTLPRPPEKDPASPSTRRTQVRPRGKSWKEPTQRSGPATARHKAISASMQLEKWPFITTEERQAIVKGATKSLRSSDTSVAKGPLPFHIDFTPEEVEAIRRAVRKKCGKQAKSKRGAHTFKELGKLLRRNPELLTIIGPELELKGELAKRDQVAIRNLLDELVDRHKRPAGQPRVLTLEVEEAGRHNAPRRSSQVPSLLFARELDGNRGFGSMRRLVNFTNEFRKAHEDDMQMRAEWVNCAGDIMTIAWTSNNNFICGATTHSDSHNQQYNKDGNLLFYSSQAKELSAYPDHRIPRPVIQEGDNSTEAMRESQSPWLYSSVVASDYDKVHNRAYTASFDKTVKVWKVGDDGREMAAMGTWQHTGIVQFVVASKHQSGMVATGAEATTQAVRVYHVNDDCISDSPFQTYSNLRTWNEGDEQTTATQKWTYYPATMQWGLCEGVQHLLLVGYSPRSISGDDNDIPEEKSNTGEICLWNCLTGERIKVLTASTQNVFEVAWHPTQPVFIVATSPAGLVVDNGTHTQVRIFGYSRQPDGEDVFGERQCLDCPAKDINELTIKPISIHSSYITAACTDGKVYVWDTARGDKPIHALKHKAPIDKEVEGVDDVGVKFTAWGTSADRFYTGGSDGKVKVWNVRNLEKPLVRDLVEAPGCVTSGAFSPDFSRLVIGDASGRVMLLSLDEEDEPTSKFTMPHMPPGLKPRNSRPVRRPLAFKPHEEPPPPPGLEARDTGVARANHFLATAQLARHPDPTVGVLQGPAYSELGLYRNELHFNGDPSQPLLAKVEESQRENQKMFGRSSRVPRAKCAATGDSRSFSDLYSQHRDNLRQDLDLQDLDDWAKMDLMMDQVDLEDPIENLGWHFEYEEE